MWLTIALNFKLLLELNQFLVFDEPHVSYFRALDIKVVISIHQISYNYLIQIGCIYKHWGSPHEHRNQMHWILIPDPDSMWSRVSSTRHSDARIAQLGWISRTVTQYSTKIGSESKPRGDKVVFESGSPICIRSRSKVPCEETHWHIAMCELYPFLLWIWEVLNWLSA